MIIIRENKENRTNNMNFIVLTTDTFDSVVNEAEIILVEFFAPWCGHCKKLAPEFEKAATTVKAEGIQLGSVDCTVETKLQERFGIKGYPTLKVFRKGVASEYNGPREERGIVDYLRKNSGPAAKNIATVQDADTFLTPRDSAIFGFFKQNSELEKKFASVANKLRETFRFATTQSSEVFKHFNIEGDNQIVIFRKEDNQRVTFSGSSTESAIENFIYESSIPLVGQLNENSKQSLQKKRIANFESIH